ncbi:MAG: hypothetical protein R3C53_17445 [Pirellulaceae bacterium]
MMRHAVLRKISDFSGFLGGLALTCLVTIHFHCVPSACAQPTRTPQASNSPAASLRSVSLEAPQTVYVAVATAEVYSGPSTDTYPTGHLERGAALQVYHRSEDGWLGIRPPENSFSWVPAADAYLLPGGKVIEITSDKSVSWIGTELGSAKQYRWQVQLEAGEQLAVLGETSTADREGRETLWYKIAPPRGEFRWIDERAITIHPPKISRASNEAAGTLARAGSAAPQNGVQPASHSLQSAKARDKAVQPANYTSDGTILLPGESIVEGGTTDLGYIEGGEYLGESHGGAIYEGEVYGGEVYEGEIYEGEIYEGEVYGGEIYEGEYYEGEYYEPGATIDGLPVRSSNSWRGWHALELTDEGFRSPFLERRYRESQARAAHDPLNLDPFDLSMAKKASPLPRALPHMTQNETVHTPSRNTPWRDPRKLRENRLRGFPQSSLSSTESDGNVQTPASLLSRLAASTARLTESNTSSPGLAAQAEAPLSSTTPSPIASNNWYGVGSQAAATGGGTVSTLSVGAAEVNQIQLVLSEMVVGPMHAWNLPPLIKQTQYLIEHGATPIERGQARLLLERIQEFDLLARKSGFGGAAVLTASAVAPSTSAVAKTMTAGYQTAVDPNAGDVVFDATGWLVPVHAASADQPTHAINNDAGQTIAYVTALPHLNLDRYLNQPVGISGLRGYLPQLQANHIQAERVVRLRD